MTPEIELELMTADPIELEVASDQEDLNLEAQAYVKGSGDGSLTEEVKQALLQMAEHVAYIDEHGQDYYQDLYDALYPPRALVYISVVYDPGTAVIYESTSLDSLKQYLVVTAHYDDRTTEIIASSDYTLSGTLEVGTSVITAEYRSKTKDFSVEVAETPTLSSITAVFTQGSAVIYDMDSLDMLKQYLTVTANYSDGTSATVTDYTLSGTLTAGTSTITVSYGGKTTTFSVTVNAVLYNLQNKAIVSTDEDDYFGTGINVCQADFACTIFLDVTTTRNATSGSANPVPKYLFEFNHATGVNGRCLTIGKQEASDTVLRFWWMATSASDYYTLTGISPNPGRFRFAVMHDANSDLAVVKCKKDSGEILTLECNRTFIPALETDSFSFGTSGNHGFPLGTIRLARICEGVASADRISAFFE